MTVVISDTEAHGQPSKKSKKSGGKGSVALLKEKNKRVVCPKVVLRRSLLKTTMRHTKFWGKQGSIAGSHAKMCASGANSVCSEIRGKNARGDPKTVAMRPQRRMGLGKGCLQTQKGRKGYILLSCRSLGNASTLLDKSRRARFRHRPRSVYAHSEQKRIQAQVNWKPFEDPGTP